MAIEAAARADLNRTALRLGPMGRTLFTHKGWNDALRQAGVAAIGYWLGNYAPLRFKYAYASSQLNYKPGTQKWRGITKHGELPFVKTGTMQNNLYMRSMPDVKAKAGGITMMVLRFPVGHIIKAETIGSFKTVPVRERNAVGRAFREALVASMRAGVAAARAKAEAKAARIARAQANKAKRQAQRERATANKEAKARALAATDRRKARMAERRAQKKADMLARRRARDRRWAKRMAARDDRRKRLGQDIDQD